MNVVKIQQEMIKDLLNNKRGKWFIQIKESDVYIMTKYQLFILSPSEFVLDIDKLALGNTNIADSLIKSAKDAKMAIKTGFIKSYISYGKEVNCMELKRADNDQLVYIDQTLLKNYDKSCEFAVINSNSPVFIYESDILVGLVLSSKIGS